MIHEKKGSYLTMTTSTQDFIRKHSRCFLDRYFAVMLVDMLSEKKVNTYLQSAQISIRWIRGFAPDFGPRIFFFISSVKKGRGAHRIYK